MDKFKIVRTKNEKYIPYKKRRLFGWKRLTPNEMPTIYAAIAFLSSNYGVPLFYDGSDKHIEIV